MAAPDAGRAPVVTVFGGSRAAEDSADYRDAYQLGRLLAERGYTLCNGGNYGTMAAAARGAKDAHGRTIGITMASLAALEPNPWIDDLVSAVTLFARLEQLATLGDAYVVLRGGIGTLLELALVWNLLQLQLHPHKPIVVLGDAWRRVLTALPRHLAVRPSDLALLTVATSPEAAVDHLDAHFAQPPDSGAPNSR